MDKYDLPGLPPHSQILRAERASLRAAARENAHLVWGQIVAPGRALAQFSRAGWKDVPDRQCWYREVTY